MKKVKMTGEEVYEVLQGLEEGPGIKKYGNAIFRMNNSSRKRTLKKKKQELDDAKEPSQMFLDYQEEIKKLQEEYADKDKKDKPQMYVDPMTRQQQYNINKKRDEYFKELEKLKKKHSEAIEEREKQMNTFKELLEKTFELPVIPMKDSEFPKYTTFAEIIGIDPIVEEDSKETFKAKKKKFKAVDIIGDPDDAVNRPLIERFQSIAGVTGLDVIRPMRQNMMNFDKAFEAIKKRKAYKDYFDVFNKERINACEVFSDKDNFGEPIVNQGRYQITMERREDFADELENIKEKNEDIIKKFKDMLDKDVEVEIAGIKMEDVTRENKELSDGAADLLIEFVD